MKDDPVIEEIHRIRREIFASCDNDINKLVNYYIELQKENEYRMIPNFGKVKRRKPRASTLNVID